MRLLVSIATALVACISSGTVFAADAIETSSVIVPLATGWHEVTGGSPISAAGPDHELMELTVVAVRPSDEHPNLARSLDSAEAAAVSSLTSNKAAMMVVAPLKDFSLPNGTHVNDLIFQSADGRHLLLGVVLRGPSSVVLATIEGASASGNRLGDALVQLLALQWK